jgi:malonyl-CoA decarboxylase
MAQSCGVMVNYRYDLNKISTNHEAYANQQSVVASKAVRALADQAQTADA